MNCKNCGSVIKDGSKFCAGCGQTVHEAALPASGYSQPVYGGYAQTQQAGFGAYPGAQQPGYNVRPQPDYGYYGGQQRTGAAASSGIKVCILFFMAAALILSAVGLMYFPLLRDSTSLSVSNNTIISAIIVAVDREDGDLGKVLKNMLENEETRLSTKCFLASLVTFLISVIFFIGGTLSIALRKYAGAAYVMGVGMIITTVGFLINFIEAIFVVSKVHSNEVKMSFAPLIMLIVCLGLAVLAFVSAGKLKKID